jgi:hypothetical protein
MDLLFSTDRYLAWQKLNFHHRSQGFVSCWLPVPDSHKAAAGAGAQGVDAPLHQPGDGLHAGVRGAHAAAVAEPRRAEQQGCDVSISKREEGDR